MADSGLKFKFFCIRNRVSMEQPRDQQQGVGTASWLGKRPAESPWEETVQADTGQVQPCGPNSSVFWAHTGSGEKLCRLGGSPWEGGSQRLLGSSRHQRTSKVTHRDAPTIHSHGQDNLQTPVPLFYQGVRNWVQYKGVKKRLPSVSCTSKLLDSV